MNKITRKYNVLFAINKNREIFNFELTFEELTSYASEQKKEYKKYYNSVIKKKLGKRKHYEQDN